MEERSGLLLLFLTAMMLGAGDVRALDIGYSLTGMYEYSNNIYRTGNTGPDEQIDSIAGGLVIRRDSPRFDFDIQAAAIYRDYYWESYLDDYELSTRSGANWNIEPGVLVWRFNDDFRQIPINTRVSTQPDNLQDRNIFSTGPELTYRLKDEYLLSLGLRYEDQYYEASEADNVRQDVQASLKHAFSTASTLSLSANHRRVQYDNRLVNRDFFQDQVFLGYAGTSARTRAGLDLGVDRIRPDDIDEISGTYVHAFLSVRLNSRLETEANYTRRYSDAVDFSRSSTAVDFDNEVDNGVYLYKELEMRTLFKDSINDLKFSLVYRERNFQSGNLDQKRSGVVVDYRRSVHPLVQMNLGGIYDSYDYLQIRRADETIDTYIGLRYLLNRSMVLGMSLSGSRRLSSDETQEYKEGRGSVSLGYLVGAR